MRLCEALSRERLHAILARLPERRVAVVGDLALDAYWYADMTISVLSRETPLFPRPVVRESYAPGAGANVAQNLAALGVGQVLALSVLGDEWRGELLQRELIQRGIRADRLVVSERRSTTTYIKLILMGHNSQQEDARVDFENAHPLPEDLEDALIDVVAAELPQLDAVLIADQLDVNGIITERVRAALNRLAEQHPDKVFAVDSRTRIGDYRGVVLKPNWVEATRAVHPDRDPRTVSRDDLADIGLALSKRSGRPVFLTLSEEGVLVCAEGQHERLPAAPVRPPLDPVGAGDTFIAAMAAGLAAGADPWEAGALANLAAGVTVEKLNQTGAAYPAEILQRYDLAAEG
ncbi:MAG: sugar kinase [Anaerolineales bacterium]|nr:sugar kinase [Anaerolineales bacterium]